MPDDIQYQEPEYTTPTQPTSSGPSAISAFVIKLGLAADQRQASQILLGVAVVGIIAALIFFVRFSGSSAKPPVPPVNGTFSSQ